MKYRNTSPRFIPAVFFLSYCFMLISCNIGDDLSHCPTLGVRVVTADNTGTGGGDDREDLQETDVDGVSLYIFDGNKKLLGHRATQIDRVELLDYPNVEQFHFVALGNVKDNFTPPTMGEGSTVDDGNILLCKSENGFLDMEIYNYPDEVFWGEKEKVKDNPTAEVVDVPVRRMVAGIYIRVLGLEEYMQAQGIPENDYTDDRFSILFGSEYDCLDFTGKPSLTARTSGNGVKHLVKGKTQQLQSGKDVFNFPEQPADPDRSANYFPVISTYEGSPVSVGIYHDESLVEGAVITTERSGKPLTVYNNKFNVIDIVFREDSCIEVQVTQCEWEEVIDIEVEF